MQYYMFHKPAGCITARKDPKHSTVMEYFKSENCSSDPYSNENQIKVNMENLNPVGRLDKDTEGLLIVTDDGHFNQMLTNPEHHIPKTYFFYVLGDLTAEKEECLKKGVILRGADTPSKCCDFVIGKRIPLKQIHHLIKDTAYEKVGKNPRNDYVTSGRITITEGKKHQVKRMLRAVDCYIVYLKREAIGGLKLDPDLEKGSYRPLTTDEMSLLCKNIYN